MATMPTPEKDEVVLFRVICSCDPKPFYEGDSETAAGRFAHSLLRDSAGENVVGHHQVRIQRAEIHWEDWAWRP